MKTIESFIVRIDVIPVFLGEESDEDKKYLTARSQQKVDLNGLNFILHAMAKDMSRLAMEELGDHVCKTHTNL